MTPLRQRYYGAALIFLLLAAFFVYRSVLAPRALTVRALSVGKGEAFLLQSPEGKYVLVDAGRDASILRALGEALPPWQRALDAVVLTSMEADDAGGLAAVLGRYQVATLVRPAEQGTYTREAALAASARADMKTIPAAPGMRLSLGSGAVIDLSLPVVRISYGATSFLIHSSASSSMTIASSTPGLFVSDGAAIMQK